VCCAYCGHVEILTAAGLQIRHGLASRRNATTLDGRLSTIPSAAATRVSLGVRLACGRWDVGCGMWAHGACSMGCGCMHVTASPRVGRYRHTGTQDTTLHAAIQIGTKRFSLPGASAVPLLPLQAGEGVRHVRCYRLVHSPVHAPSSEGCRCWQRQCQCHPHTLTSTRPPANPALRSQPDTASHISPHRPWQRRIHSTAGRWPPVGEKAPRPTTRGARMPLKPP
jgi:hypothetical protein